jgi:hypothetical protein
MPAEIPEKSSAHDATDSDCQSGRDLTDAPTQQAEVSSSSLAERAMSDAHETLRQADEAAVSGAATASDRLDDNKSPHGRACLADAVDTTPAHAQSRESGDVPWCAWPRVRSLLAARASAGSVVGIMSLAQPQVQISRPRRRSECVPLRGACAWDLDCATLVQPTPGSLLQGAAAAWYGTSNPFVRHPAAHL